jgi:hypothetical protein
MRYARMAVAPLLVLAVACSDSTTSPSDRPTLNSRSATADLTAGPPNECASPQFGWIWCDDFEQDRSSSYFEIDRAGGKLTRQGSVGVAGSYAMAARYQPGDPNAGNLKLAFGRTPSSYFRPVDNGTANYRELYWRVYVKNQSGWTGGGGGKLARAMIFAKADWSQAMIAHLWTAGTSSKQVWLHQDPARGTDAAGNLQTSGYNDFSNLDWLGSTVLPTPIFDSNHVGHWYCIESHVKLNDPGSSNGVFESWIDGKLQARQATLNWVGSYNAYGLNAVFLENYWNYTAPVAETRYLDNFVVSTKPIGCLGSAPTTSPTTGSSSPTVASVKVSPSSVTLATGGTKQLNVTALDSAGNTLDGRSVTWSTSASSVASVSSTGLVTGNGVGSAMIAVSVDGVSGQTSVTDTSVSSSSGSGSTSGGSPSGSGGSSGGGASYGADEPVPTSTSKVFFDTRPGGAQDYQKLNSLQEALAVWTNGYRGPVAWTTNMDGNGRHALRWDWSSSPTEQDGVVERSLPSVTGRMVTSWKIHLGRTSTGGGVGNVGYYGLNNGGGTKRFLWLRQDGTYRIYLVWRDYPSNDYNTFAIDGVSWNSNPISGNPYAYVGQEQRWTVEMVLPNTIRAWVNGVKVLDQSNANLGTTPFTSIQTPATMNYPAAAMSEYWYDVVVWQ